MNFREAGCLTTRQVKQINNQVRVRTYLKQFTYTSKIYPTSPRLNKIFSLFTCLKLGHFFIVLLLEKWNVLKG